MAVQPGAWLSVQEVLLVTAEAGLPTPTAEAARDLVAVAKELRTLCNRLDMVRERLFKDELHHGIMGDEASAERVALWRDREAGLVRTITDERADIVRRAGILGWLVLPDRTVPPGPGGDSAGAGDPRPASREEVTACDPTSTE